jgi:hypothetical protein
MHMNAAERLASLRMNTSFARSFLVIVTFATALAGTAGAETRGFAISLIHTATYSDKVNCPKGGNGGPVDLKRRVLAAQGFTPEQISKFLAGETTDDVKDTDYAKGAKEGDGQASAKLPSYKNLTKRGLKDGKPADVADFPTSEPDPQIETVQGHFAYGFNFEGHATPSSFEDPDTHQPVQNQMWRVLGCYAVYAVRRPVVPYNESIAWDTAMDSMPAWLMSVTGDHLDKDGDVTVTFDRSLDVAMRNTHGGVLAGSSYTIDPDPRSHSVFKGHIRDGVLSIDPGPFSMQGESQFYAVLRFTQTHLRMKMAPDGSLSGFIGGYQPWMDYYRYLAIRGEDTAQVDIAGVYYAMKRFADAVPDPVTHENTAISTAYYMEAVPAFLTSVDRQVVALSQEGESTAP